MSAAAVVLLLFVGAVRAFDLIECTPVVVDMGVKLRESDVLVAGVDSLQTNGGVVYVVGASVLDPETRHMLVAYDVKTDTAYEMATGLELPAFDLVVMPEHDAVYAFEGAIFPGLNGELTIFDLEAGRTGQLAATNRRRAGIANMREVKRAGSRVVVHNIDSITVFDSPAEATLSLSLEAVRIATLDNMVVAVTADETGEILSLRLDENALVEVGRMPRPFLGEFDDMQSVAITAGHIVVGTSTGPIAVMVRDPATGAALESSVRLINTGIELTNGWAGLSADRNLVFGASYGDTTPHLTLDPATLEYKPLLGPSGAASGWLGFYSSSLLPNAPLAMGMGELLVRYNPTCKCPCGGIGACDLATPDDAYTCTCPEGTTGRNCNGRVVTYTAQLLSGVTDAVAGTAVELFLGTSLVFEARADRTATVNVTILPGEAYDVSADGVSFQSTALVVPMLAVGATESVYLRPRMAGALESVRVEAPIDTETGSMAELELALPSALAVSAGTPRADQTEVTFTHGSDTVGKTTGAVARLRDEFGNLASGEVSVVLSLSGANTGLVEGVQTGVGEFTMTYKPSAPGKSTITIQQTQDGEPVEVDGSPWTRTASCSSLEFDSGGSCTSIFVIVAPVSAVATVAVSCFKVRQLMQDRKKQKGGSSSFVEMKDGA